MIFLRVLTKIDVKSFAKFYAVMMLTFGVIGGVVGFFPALAREGIGAGLGALLLFPLLYGAFGFLAGYLFGYLMNFALKKTNGLMFEVSDYSSVQQEVPNQA